LSAFASTLPHPLCLSPLLMIPYLYSVYFKKNYIIRQIQISHSAYYYLV